jgi:hypothetical protein
VQEKELGGGVLLDIGLYSLHLATLVFGMEKPVKVILKGTGTSNSESLYVSMHLL